MVRYVWCLLLTLTSVSGFSQIEYAADRIPIALKSRANAVLRNMETTVDMRASDNMIQTVKEVITVLNKNGDRRAALLVYYDKNTTIQKIKGQVLDANGNTISKFAQNDFSDQSAVSNGSLFVGYRLKYYAPQAFNYPYTVVYEYELKHKQNLIIPEWDATPYEDLAVEKNKYTFISKPNDEIRIKEYNYSGKPQLVKAEKSNIYTWEIENKQAFKSEPFSPDPENYKTSVKIAAKQFSYYGRKGSYENWDQLGKWIFNDLIKDRQALPPETVLEMKNLVQGIESDREKVKKIYEYMQKKTRYISVQIGIGGFQPMPATEVQTLSYGDCKALVNYMQSLLKAVDIPSLYCVVNAGNFKKGMDPDFASMEQGNHVILSVPLKSDTVWLECTSSDSPFGFLGDFTDDRLVLACSAEGGKLLKTPALSTAENSLKRKAELDISKDGRVAGKLETTFSGSQYDNYNYLINQPYAEQLKLLKQKYDIDNINFLDFKVSQDKGIFPTTTEQLNLEIPKYAVNSNSLVYLVINAFNRTRDVLTVKNRTLPLYINRGYTDEDEIVYNLPEGYALEVKWPDKEFKTPFGEYTRRIKMDGQKLIYQRKLVINEGTYAPEKYSEFSSFMSQVSSEDNVKVIFKTK